MAFQEYLVSLYANPAVAFLVNLFQHNVFYFTLGLLAVIALVFAKSNTKRVALIVAILLVAATLPVVKNIYAEPRPCAGLPTCEPDYGFPSGHASLAFVLVGATLGTAAFYFFLPVAVFIALSRVISGVHTLSQIAGGMVFGFLIFLICEKIAEYFIQEKETPSFGGKRRK